MRPTSMIRMSLFDFVLADMKLISVRIHSFSSDFFEIVSLNDRADLRQMNDGKSHAFVGCVYQGCIWLCCSSQHTLQKYICSQKEIRDEPGTIEKRVEWTWQPAA